MEVCQWPEYERSVYGGSSRASPIEPIFFRFCNPLSNDVTHSEENYVQSENENRSTFGSTKVKNPSNWYTKSWNCAQSSLANEKPESRFQLEGFPLQHSLTSRGDAFHD